MIGPRPVRKGQSGMASGRSLQTFGAALVLGGVFAVAGAGMLMINYDPALAGPEADDARPMAAAILAAGAGAVVAGIVLTRRDERHHGETREPSSAERRSWSPPQPPESDLLLHDTLVIDKTLVALSPEYRVFDANGRDVGNIGPEGSTGRGYHSVLDDVPVDHFSGPQGLTLHDASGRKVLDLACPGHPTVHVADGSGRSIGTIIDQGLAQIRLTVQSPDGQPMGSITADPWWSGRDFSVQDANGSDVGHIHKESGLATYVLTIAGFVSPEMRLMMFASPAGLDVLEQQSHR